MDQLFEHVASRSHHSGQRDQLLSGAWRQRACKAVIVRWIPPGVGSWKLLCGPHLIALDLNASPVVVIELLDVLRSQGFSRLCLIVKAAKELMRLLQDTYVFWLKPANCLPAAADCCKLSNHLSGKSSLLGPV